MVQVLFELETLPIDDSVDAIGIGFAGLCGLRNNINSSDRSLLSMTNIFDLPSSLPNKELFEPLVSADNILIERIISTGQTTPPGEWYDGAYKLPNSIRETAPYQDKDEWVILLQGEAVLAYADGSQIKLAPGDYLFIPAHQKHRVEYTSIEPPCIWLAVHGNMSKT